MEIVRKSQRSSRRKDFFTRFTREEVLEGIQNLFIKWGMTSKQVEEGDDIWNNWELSSAEVVNILRVFVSRYRLEEILDDDVVENVATIGDIIDAVENAVIEKMATFPNDLKPAS